jgi:acyl-CoA dehydrogenase
MSEQDALIHTIRDILNEFEPFVLTPERRWDAPLWAELAGAGWTGVGLPEEAGGSGGELADAVAVVRALAAGAGAVPVAEHLLVAGPALVAAGLVLPPLEAPLTFAGADTVRVEVMTDDDGPQRFSITGCVDRVAWAGVASSVVLLAPAPTGGDGSVVLLVDPSSAEVTDACNLAGEPRGALVLAATPAVGATVTEEQAAALRARFALARSVQLAAALEQVLAWTVQYARERVQFGRPLGTFQAIQMELAAMAGEVTAVSALTDAAVHALDRGEDVVLAAAAAKVRAGAAVEVVARHSHQVHGAIGFTQEYKLHHLTRRLWSWRDEAGSELFWSRVLGAGLASASPGGHWARLTQIV